MLICAWSEAHGTGALRVCLNPLLLVQRQKKIKNRRARSRGPEGLYLFSYPAFHSEGLIPLP